MSLTPRFSWPADFPDVAVHTTVAARDSHPAYGRAKAGDPDSALTLAIDLLDATVTEKVREVASERDAVLLPVVADETTGFNAIPDAMAQVLGRNLSLRVTAGEVVQTNKVGHTRAPSFQRLATPATFGGTVLAGATYVLVDDHVGLGGTMANLRGYVESQGGRVIGMTTLTESRDARRISLRSETIICYGNGMANSSIDSGESNSATGSTASPTSKASSYVVSNPLPTSRVFWLRQQSKRVAAVSRQRLDGAD